MHCRCSEHFVFLYVPEESFKEMSLLSLKVQIAGDTWIHGKPSLFSTQNPCPNHGEQQATIFVCHAAVVLVYTKASGAVTRLQESGHVVNF